MAQVSECALRLAILQEAIDRYNAESQLAHATFAELSLSLLKIAECEAMIRELMAQPDKE